MKRISLSKLIFKQYARTALLTILTIEALLLLAYFGTSAYFLRETQEVLEHEVKAVVPEIARLAAQKIRDDFAMVERNTLFFAQLHAELFAYPDAFQVHGEKPVIVEAPDGSESLYQSNLTEGSGLFIPGTAVPKMNAELWRFATNSVALNPHYRHLVESTPNVVAAYINLDEPADLNRLYPYIPEVWKQYPPDIDMKDYNFFYLANESNNPGRGAVWTEVYWDPAGNGWMLSCVAPVYAEQVLKGVVGLDVTVKAAATMIDQLRLPWGALALLVAADGEVLASSGSDSLQIVLRQLEDQGPNVQQTVAQPAENSIGKLTDPLLRAGLERLMQKKDEQTPAERIVSSNGAIIATKTDIFAEGQAPEWKLLVLVQESTLLKSVDELARRSELIGWVLLVTMALFYLWFFRFLRSRAQRMAAMIADPVESEIRAKNTELAYTRGLYESASGYLHNVGNAITLMESSLMDLDKVVKSSEQYPEAFRRIQAGGASGAETLKRFEEVLVGKTVPALKAVADSVRRIKDSIRNAISHQQAGFRAVVRQAAEDIDLSELLDDMCEVFRREHPALVGKINPNVRVRGHREPLLQGLDNVIRNAIQASAPGENIVVACEAAKDGALVTVTDQGRGIAAGDLPKVTRAGFTTRKDGHGLGLHSFAIFLSASGGQLSVKSEGLGRGATVVIDVRNA